MEWTKALFEARLTQPLRFTASFPWTPRHRERKHCLKCDWLRYARLSLCRLGNNKTRWLCCAHSKNKERWLSIKLEVTSLLFLDSTSNTLFVIALALLVIPAGWSVSASDAHRGLFFRLTLHSLMQFSILKFGAQILLIFSATLPLILVTLLTKIAKLFWKN